MKYAAILLALFALPAHAEIMLQCVPKAVGPQLRPSLAAKPLQSIQLGLGSTLIVDEFLYHGKAQYLRGKLHDGRAEMPVPEGSDGWVVSSEEWSCELY